MKRIGAEQARARLPELLEQANRGQVTVITKRGRPYAALVPVQRVQRPRGASTMALKGSGRGCWGEDSRKTLREMRDEWD